MGMSKVQGKSVIFLRTIRRQLNMQGVQKLLYLFPKKLLPPIIRPIIFWGEKVKSFLDTVFQEDISQRVIADVSRACSVGQNSLFYVYMLDIPAANI